MFLRPTVSDGFLRYWQVEEDFEWEKDPMSQFACII